MYVKIGKVVKFLIKLLPAASSIYTFHHVKFAESLETTVLKQIFFILPFQILHFDEGKVS